MDKLLRIITLILLGTVSIFSQIKVTSLISNKNNSIDNFIFGNSSTRTVFLINDNWKVYKENSSSKFSKTNLPAVFVGDDELVFERKLELTQSQIDNSIVKIGFLGINNVAEIFINGNNIFNNSNAILPFEIILPKDFLRADKSNIISVKVKYKIDSENTIPIKQRFLFPEIGKGIIRDVYVKILPKVNISRIDCINKLNSNATSGKINFNIKIENYLPKPKFGQSNDVIINVNIFSPNQQLLKFDFTQSLGTKEITDANFEVQVSNIIPWSPENPNSYSCEINLIKDGVLVDKQLKQISFYKFEKNNSLTLNGNSFSFKGTTYLLNETKNEYEDIYDIIKKDLLLIKQTGFNSVRFSKSFPHPFAIKLCNEIGLFALIETPLNSIPENFFENNEFKLKVISLEKDFISTYLNFSNTFLFGIGSSFLPNSDITEKFISQVTKEINYYNILNYASFVGLQKNTISNLDFYGVEIFSSPIESIKNSFTEINPSIKNTLFVSELTYSNYKGTTSGYLVKNSVEAQAKYYDDFINLTEELNINGFFINTLLNYKGVYESFFSGYTGDSNYKISVLSKYRNTNNLSYKVLESNLNNGSKVAIPIGIRKEENPIEFILIALFLAIMMAILINSKRKFREDASRALLKSYNFFADIRDHRIISSFHTTLLMLLVSATFSLLFTILLYYYKDNFLLEKIILSFASTRLSSSISFLA
ncbi:MAG: hypothetical protein N2321_12175, partial [Melioribacteraceae bacterium]|nr:hypothetical protein [Melioribacteraceae bacterium]